jgi:hypothetical protein
MQWIDAPQIQPTDRDETPVTTQSKRLATIIRMYLNRDASGLSFATTLASIRPFLQQLEALGAPARAWALDAQAAVILAQLDDTERRGMWRPTQTQQLIMNFWPHSDAASPADRPNLRIPELLAALLEARGFVDPQGVAAFYDSLRTASPTVAVIDKTGGGAWGQLIRILHLTPFQAVGTVAKPLHGTYWYQAPGLAVSGQTWPHAGHVSLLLTFTNDLGIGRAAMVRRLAAQYGDKGLSITLVTKTQGYWLKSGVNTGPVTPAREAAEDSAYYLGYLHLPVTLMVDSTTFTRDAEGRLYQKASVPFESAYGSKLNMVVVADRTGHLIVADAIRDEARLTAYVKKALGQ